MLEKDTDLTSGEILYCSTLWNLHDQTRTFCSAFKRVHVASQQENIETDVAHALAEKISKLIFNELQTAIEKIPGFKELLLALLSTPKDESNGVA